MPRGKLIVFNEPASPEVEEEYNAWYGGDHVPQILASVPTITGAKRYRIAPGRTPPSQARRATSRSTTSRLTTSWTPSPSSARRRCTAR